METLKFKIQKFLTIRVIAYGIFLISVVMLIVTAIMVYVTAYAKSELVNSQDTIPLFSRAVFDPVFQLNERKSAIPELSVSESRFE
ncbi:MAG: hypothetical protein HYZ08_01675 [Candidatus Kerfeldbacteria bacterium]|nr:hypothetical protein [Candidatus Kerfeldbacteria bacterium]